MSDYQLRNAQINENFEAKDAKEFFNNLNTIAILPKQMEELNSMLSSYNDHDLTSIIKSWEKHAPRIDVSIEVSKKEIGVERLNLDVLNLRIRSKLSR